MKVVSINREKDYGTGGSIDATATAEHIKRLIIENPEPPRSVEEWFGLVATSVRQMQRCLENGQISLFQAWVIFLSVKAGATANSLYRLPLELPNPYFINQYELGQRKEAA